MKHGVDPRLVQIIDEAGDEDVVEAVVMLNATTSGHSDERGAGGPLMDRVVQKVQQEPTETRFMPKLGVLYVKGSPRLIRQLLDEKEVKSATSGESEFFQPE